MNKKCKQCDGEFAVDEAFFRKVSPSFVEMPMPTFCPHCRQVRRMIFRNDRAFYNRKCDLSGKQFISTYSPDSLYTVYHPDEWYGDKWDPKSYGRDYDFSRTFFEQFAEFMLEVPRLGIDIVNCQNSYYCNFCGDDKNCYLDIAGEGNEDSYFNLFVKYSRDVVDCTFVYNSELCYECINCYDCYSCQHSMYLDNCSDCLFCFDLKGCKDCLFSYGLRNKQYFIFNEQKTRSEYEDYVNKLQLGSYDQRQKLMEGWRKFKKEKAVHRANSFINCENVSGDNLKNCKNVFESFNAGNCEDCAYLYDVLEATDCQDLNYSLYKPELSYELISTLNLVKSAFSMASHYNSEVFYCDMTNNSRHLFGCIGLNHGEYCILNKQYTKEEYEELVLKIVVKMAEAGEWGEFFPVELSPFAYNETVANEYFPLSAEEAHTAGFKWREDNREKVYKGPSYELADKIADVPDDVVKQVLICEKSGLPYRVIESELKFYRKLGVPVPRLAPDQRHKDRLALRNLRKLFERKCSKCLADLGSTYAGEREEKVYCEECYLKELD